MEHITIQYLFSVISDLFSKMKCTVYFTENNSVTLDWWDLVIGGFIIFLGFKIFNGLME